MSAKRWLQRDLRAAAEAAEAAGEAADAADAADDSAITIGNRSCLALDFESSGSIVPDA